MTDDMYELGDQVEVDGFNGVSRVEELENVLGQILDYYDEDLISVAKYSSTEEREVIMATFEKAYSLLAEGE